MAMAATMNIAEAIEQIGTLDRSITICARRPWSSDAECVLVTLDRGVTVPKATAAAGFEYFLDVHVILEVLSVFGERTPTADEQVRLILFYAENDAYPDWVHERV